MTRPVGASTGDLLGSSTADGGWGLGFGYTSLLFFGIICLIVAFLMYTRIDVIADNDKNHVQKVTVGGGSIVQVEVIPSAVNYRAVMTVIEIGEAV